ncbi:MAG: hypothetical protein Greene041662_449 [Candidatus Peregrinibacteria bacterium Greene0416_62]|nr:MAG: hypothetical protein Greene041662_449 [Candidatus Peregrinibacteria bacterium Greene0416_62]TSC99113.1 MAG: hypothetical protein Greene101449_735 [Candidatus Peregrinibacteria bacterium Greene1014_49]
MIEAHTPEAVAASEAVFAVLRLAAVLAVLTVIAGITRCAIDAFGAPFAENAERKTGAGNTLPGIPRIIDIFGIKDAETVITVFGLHGGVRILAVVGTHLLQIIAGAFEEEPSEGFKEEHCLMDWNRSIHAMPYQKIRQFSLNN